MQGIYVASQGGIRALATTKRGSPFASIPERASISTHAVAFEAVYRDGTKAALAGPVGAPSVVIRTGDVLFGSRVVDVTVYGINAIEFTRPYPGEHQTFYGPLDDADGDTDAYLPLIRKSEFCAPCHACEFWGVPVYTSFPEWEASEYKTMGIQCQACHYRPDGIMRP